MAVQASETGDGDTVFYLLTLLSDALINLWEWWGWGIGDGVCV